VPVQIQLYSILLSQPALQFTEFRAAWNSRDTIPIRPATNQVLCPRNTTKSKA